MKTIKRAIYYVIRKRGKSFLLFLVLFVIAAFVLSGLSVKKASITAQKNLRQSLGGTFNVGLRYSKENPYYNEEEISENGETSMVMYCTKQISSDMVKNISNIANIQNCNATETDLCRMKGMELFPGNIPVDDEFKNYQTMVATYTSQNNMDFIKGDIRLVEGRHLKPDDNHVILMSKDLADKNNLSLDDMVSILDSKDAEVKVKIVGIFEPKEIENVNDKITVFDKVQNRIYTDINTCLKVENSDFITGYSEITAMVTDPQNIEKILEEVKKVDGYDDKVFEINVDDEMFKSAEGTLKKVETMMSIFLYSSLVISVVILSLILTMWSRNRIHETGVYLALGLKKRNIIWQYLLEVLIIGSIAFGLAYFPGQIISDKLATYVLDSGTEQFDEQRGDSATLGSELDDEDIAENELNVRIGNYEMLELYVIGVLIIIISIGLSSFYIILLKPREILAKMS